MGCFFASSPARAGRWRGGVSSPRGDGGRGGGGHHLVLAEVAAVGGLAVRAAVRQRNEVRAVVVDDAFLAARFASSFCHLDPIRAVGLTSASEATRRLS